MGSQTGVGSPAYDRIKAAAGQDAADAIQQLTQLLSGLQVDLAQVLGVRIGTGADVRALRCLVYNSAAQVLVSGVGAALTFDSEDVDPAGMHSVAANTSRITVPVAGLYRVHARASYDPSAVGQRQLVIRKNGATNLAHVIVAVNAAGVATVFECHVAMVLLAAGDYIEVNGFQDSGGNLNCGQAVRSLAAELAVDALYATPLR